MAPTRIGTPGASRAARCRVGAAVGHGHLHCVVVTYRRPKGLEAVVRSIAHQTRVPDTLIVVDNEGSDTVALIVSEYRMSGRNAVLLRPPENTGPAGGTALAMQWVLDNGGADDDWIIRLDDDRPAPAVDLLERLEGFARAQRSLDVSVGAVGVVGSRYDWTRGRLVRIGNEELSGPVDVDYVATNCFPAFSVGAVRDVGLFNAELFYGSSEVEYGLRLRSAGRRIVAHGPMWMEMGRASEVDAGPSRQLAPWNWRRYYSLRNQIHMLRRAGHAGVALRVIVVRAIGKPLLNLPRSPRLAATHLRWNMRAALDGWVGRLGRTVEPDD